MKKSRLILLAVMLLVAVTAMMVLSGCTTSPYTEFADQGQKDIAKDAPVLKVATNAEFAPFESIVGGKYDGYDIAMINAIATKLGMKVVISNMEFEGILAAVQSGGYDIAVAGMTVTDERKLSVDFTDTYFQSSQVIVVKTATTKFDGLDEASLLAALEGTKIHVATGQMGHYFAEGSDAFGYDGIPNAVIKLYSSTNLAAQGIVNDEAAFFDIEVAKNFVAKASGFKMINVPLTSEEYAIGINKSKTELKGKINDALAELKADGTIDKIKAHYGIL